MRKQFFPVLLFIDPHVSMLKMCCECLPEQAGPQQVSACMGATLTTAEMCASPADLLGVPGMSAARSSRSSPVLLCLSHCTASLKASGVLVQGASS